LGTHCAACPERSPVTEHVRPDLVNQVLGLTIGLEPYRRTERAIEASLILRNDVILQTILGRH
jgi:hypothetical protein